MGRNLLFLLFLVSTGFGLSAQKQSTLDIALRYLEENGKNMSLLSSDYSDMVVSSEFYNKATNATYLYVNQAYRGVTIKNAIMLFAVRNGEVVHVTEGFHSDIANKVVSTRSSIGADLAVIEAASTLGVTSPEKPVSNRSANDGKSFVFEPTSYASSPILVDLMLDMKDDQLLPVWQVTMDMSSSADYWEIRMDARSGQYVSKNNLTVYCNHQPGKYGKHHDHKDCNISTYHKINRNAKNLSTSLSMADAAYRVYALPAESPSHGPYVLVEDPAILEASPFGWHDVDGVEGADFTTTRGNNVFAFTDLNDDDQPDPEVAQPDGGDALIFDFPHNTDLDPVESPDAAQTNLFYMVNMIHDVTALYGFDEAAGNFQVTNYSGAGAGNDMVLAQAFDGFETGSLNNANFATPADGNSGRMQMFLWQAASGAVSIDEPDQIAGFLDTYGTAQFGDPIPGVNDEPVSGEVATGSGNNPSNPTTSCDVVNEDLTGKIALIDRGLCDFSQKVLNAQNAGAIGCVICNVVGVNGGDGEETLNMAAGDGALEVTIPSIFAPKSVCDRMRASLAVDIPVSMTFQTRENSGPDFLDGAFDNGIIAHEFGHGISNRLTGGRTAAGCLGNDDQMGEGWSDFFSLIMTVEEGDLGTDARGIGTYATGESVNGRGIRRFPYSTDMSINPQTYDDIKGTTAPHPLGEVWVDMLWDMYWMMVDKYGFDADITNIDSGNGRAVQLVMEGMKLQGCNPGFIAGRNGILSADELLFNGENNCDIWEVFARRGLGWTAQDPSSNDRNDGVENYDPRPTCIEELKIAKTATSLVRAGDEILVTIDAINHIPGEAQTGVVITDELPAGLTYVAGSGSMEGTVSGNVITFEVGDMAFEEELTITYRAMTDPDQESKSMERYSFEDGNEWDNIISEGFDLWVLDDLAGANSGINSYRIPATEVENDHSILSPTFTVSGDQPVLRFFHKFITESGADGGFLQISTDGGNVWSIISGDKFIRNGYPSVINYGTFAIPALEGFTGNQGEVFQDSYVDLSDYAGQDIRIRFRFGTDEQNTVGDLINGWIVDDVEFIDILSYEAKACIENGDQSSIACTDATTTFIDAEITSDASNIDNDHFSIELTPNPATEYVTIDVSSKSNEIAKLSITSIDGQTIAERTVRLQPSSNKINVNVSTFPSGFYLVKIQNGKNQLTRKLIVE